MSRASQMLCVERLLAIDVLVPVERQQRGEGVGVLAGADDHGVEVGGPVEQLAEIGERAGLRMRGLGGVERRPAHVAQGDDVLGGDALEVGRAAAAGADDGDVQLVVEVLAAEDRRRAGHDAGRGQRATDELTTGNGRSRRLHGSSPMA